MPAPVKDPKTGQFVAATETQEPPPAEGAAVEGAGEAEAAAKAKKKEEEQIDMSGIRAMSAAALGIKEEDLGKPAAKKKDEKKEKEAAAAAKAAAAKKAPKAATKATPAAAPSAEEIGKAVAAAIKPAEKDTKKDEAPDPDKDLPAGERKKLSVMREMAALHPELYKDLDARYRAGQKKLAEYVAEWKKANPRKEFNADEKDEDGNGIHDEFFDANDVDYEDDHFEEAKESLLVKKAKEEAKKELEASHKPDPEVEALKVEKKLREHAPKIMEHQNQAATSFWNKAGEEYEGFLDEKGQVNQEKAKELMAANPEATGLMVKFAQTLDHEIEQLYQVMHGLAQFDKENPAHVAIGRFAHTMEQGLLQKPEEERLNEEGKAFMAAADYYKLPAEKRADYWTYSLQDIAAMRAAALAKHAKKLIADDEAAFKKRAERLKLVEAPVQNNGESKEEEVEEEVEPTRGKPKSPSSSPESKLAATKGKRGDGEKDPLATFGERYLS
jgi:hypothetical protein